MEPHKGALRQPSAAYKNTNGFIPRFSNDDHLTPGPELTEATDAYKRARFVLDFKKRPLPSGKDLSAEVKQLKGFPPVIPERPPTRNWDGEADFLDKREKLVKERYLHDLGTLAAIQADEYREELRNRHFSKPEDELEGTPGQTRLQTLYSEPIKNFMTRCAWSDELEMLDYAYHSQRQDVANDKEMLKRQREDDKKRREQEFPLSVEAFEAKRQDVQIRVARYLVADEYKKRLMKNEFRWSDFEVVFLEQEFAQSGSPFSKKIKEMIASEQAVRDPRKRYF